MQPFSCTKDETTGFFTYKKAKKVPGQMHLFAFCPGNAYLDQI